MFCYKFHRNRSENYELVLGICDKELAGKILRKDPEFKVGKKFYCEKECDEEGVLELIKRCTIANLVGKKIIELAIRRKFIIKENVILIGDTPHAQIVK